MVCGGGTLDDPSLPESSAGPTIRPNLAHQSAQRARQGRTDVSARPRLLSSGLSETHSFSGRFVKIFLKVLISVQLFFFKQLSGSIKDPQLGEHLQGSGITISLTI